jgi:hypothetical protein
MRVLGNAMTRRAVFATPSLRQSTKTGTPKKLKSKKTNAKYKYTDAEKATGHPVAFC